MRVELPAESLIGREMEIHDVESLLDTTRFVTLTGLGGTGKTRLARAIADRARVNQREAAFVDLADVHTVERVATSIADALRLELPPNRSAPEGLIDSLATWSGLIILDNLEQLVASSDLRMSREVRGLVDLITHASAEIRVLATSRVPIGAAGETDYPVHALALPKDDSLAAVESSASSALFLRELRRVGFARQTDIDPGAVARICTAAGGLPLGILLAARACRVLPLADVVDWLASSARPTSPLDKVTAVIDWSIELLDDSGASALDYLVAIPGAFSASDAVALIDTASALADVDRLIELGLVERGVDDRLTVPIPVRQRMIERGGDHQDARMERLLSFALGRISTLAPCLRDQRLSEASRAIRQLEPTVLAALEWATVIDPAGAVQLLDSLTLYWSRAGRIRILDAAVAGLSSSSLTASDRAIVDLLTAEAALALSGPDAARPPAENALRSARAIGDRRREQRALQTLGRILINQPNAENAIEPSSQALVLAEELGDLGAAAAAAGALGILLATLGRNAEAEKVFERAVGLAREAGDEFAHAMLLANMSALVTTRSETSLERSREADRMLTALGPSEYRAFARISLGEALVATGHLEEALDVCRSAVDLTIEEGGWFERLLLLSTATLALSARGRYADAARLSGAARRVQEVAGHTEGAQELWINELHARAARMLGATAHKALEAVGYEAGAAAIEWLPDLLVELPSDQPEIHGPFGRLSPREREVLRLVGRGASDGEIGETLGISPKTASVHVVNLKTKLGLETRIELALAARDVEEPTS